MPLNLQTALLILDVTNNCSILDFPSKYIYIFLVVIIVLIEMRMRSSSVSSYSHVHICCLRSVDLEFSAKQGPEVIPVVFVFLGSSNQQPHERVNISALVSGSSSAPTAT